MAFGIDDFLMTAAAGVNLSDTLVRTIRNNTQNNSLKAGDLEALVQEVKANAIGNINDAHAALNKFERMLKEREVDLSQPLHEIVRKTPFWRPVEAFRLSTAKRAFDHFGENVYRSCDDIAALLRCSGKFEGMGTAVVESSKVKHEFQQRFVNAASVADSIQMLREELDRQKSALSG